MYGAHMPLALPTRPLHPITGRPSLIIDIYCRISQDYDGTTRSVESQEDDCRFAIAEHAEDGWMVGEVFQDHAKSAWNPRVVRKQWEALMTRLESGESDGLIVYDLTRFTRKPIEGERLIEQAKRGIVVASIENRYNLNDPDGRAHFRQDMTAAAKESDKISQRSSRGKKKKASRGRSNSTSVRGYGRPGYLPRPDGWEFGDPLIRVSDEQVAAERAVVQEMCERIVARETMAEIVRDLDQRGIRTAAGAIWSNILIRQMLKRPSLCGLVEYKGEIVAEMKDAEPVVSRELWEAVQATFRARKRGRPATSYLLSGLVRCSHCGYVLYGRPMYARKPYEDGSIARGYYCGPVAPGRGCGKMSIDQRFADQVIARAVIAKMSDPAYAESMAKAAASLSAERLPLEERLASLRKDMESVASKIVSRGFDWVEAASTAIEDEMAKVQAALDAIDTTSVTSVAAENVATEWKAAEEAGNLLMLRTLIATAFPKLTILPAEGPRQWGQTVSAERFDFEGTSLPSNLPKSPKPRLG